MKAIHILFRFFSLILLSSCQKDCEKPPVDPKPTDPVCSTSGFSKSSGGLGNDKGLGTAMTSDGGYITVGTTTETVVSDNDIYIVRFNNKGEKLWEKKFGGSGNDLAFSVITGVDGGFVIGAYTNSTDRDIIGNHGEYDIWLLKLSDAGELMWKRTLGGNKSETDTRVVKTGDSYFIAATSSSTDIGNNHGSADILIMKIDVSGNVIGSSFYGGNNNEDIRNLIGTPDGGCLVIGSTNSTTNEISTKGQKDVWVMKVNASLQLVWQRSYGGSQSDGGDGIVATQDGGYIVISQIFSSDGDFQSTTLNEDGDMWVFKINSAGTIVWKKRFAGSTGEWPRDIIASRNGTFLICGFTFSNDGDFTDPQRRLHNAFVLKIDDAGNKRWLRTIGSNNYDYAYGIVKADDCSFTLAGYSSGRGLDLPDINNGGYDLWIYKGADQ